LQQPPLKSLHPDLSLSQPKLDEFRKLSDEQLIDSLKVGQPNSLKARPDGTLIEGTIALRFSGKEESMSTPCHGKSCRRIRISMTTYQIEGPWRGRLAIVPRPRGGDWIADEVRAWKDEGFDVVVSLLTTGETRDLGLTDEANLSRSHGLQFYGFQIPDLGVPSSMVAAQEFLERLTNELAAGKKVAVHCRQSIGRSGLIAASLLSLSGIDPETAFQRVSAARGLPVPETPEQKIWVRRLAEEFAAPTATR
jgi:protein-tyrosine phosphatase